MHGKFGRNTDRAIEQFLWLHSELSSRPRATKHSCENVRGWLWNHPGTIIDDESKFAYDDDRMNVVAQKKSPLHDFLLRTDIFDSLPFLRAQASLKDPCGL